MNTHLEKFTKILNELDATRAIGQEAGATLILAVTVKEGLAKIADAFDDVTNELMHIASNIEDSNE